MLNNYERSNDLSVHAFYSVLHIRYTLPHDATHTDQDWQKGWGGTRVRVFRKSGEKLKIVRKTVCALYNLLNSPMSRNTSTPLLLSHPSESPAENFLLIYKDFRRMVELNISAAPQASKISISFWEAWTFLGANIITLISNFYCWLACGRTKSPN